MAYVIKSNVEVTNTEKAFDYYTRYGAADEVLKLFIDDMDSAGYTLESTEFTALNTFINNLKTAGIWGSVREVYPLMGSGINTALIKLKAFSSNRVMTAIRGFSDSHLEIVGGKVIGKAETPVVYYPPHINTGIIGNQLQDLFGITAAIGAVPASDSENGIFGSLGSQGGIFAGLRNGSSPATTIANTSQQLTTNQLLNTGPMIVDFHVQAENVRIYTNGDLERSDSLSNRGDYTTNVDYMALFARNNNGTLAVSTFQASCRFVVLSDGSLSTGQLAVLRNEINTVMTALGKAYA